MADCLHRLCQIRNSAGAKGNRSLQPVRPANDADPERCTPVHENNKKAVPILANVDQITMTHCCADDDHLERPAGYEMNGYSFAALVH